MCDPWSEGDEDTKLERIHEELVRAWRRSPYISDLCNNAQ